jgi:hypothetical protein
MNRSFLLLLRAQVLAPGREEGMDWELCILPVTEEEEWRIWEIVGFVDVMISLKMLSKLKGLARLVSISMLKWDKGIGHWGLDFGRRFMSCYSTHVCCTSYLVDIHDDDDLEFPYI